MACGTLRLEFSLAAIASYYWPSLGFFKFLVKILLQTYDVALTSSLPLARSFIQFRLNCVSDLIFHSLVMRVRLFNIRTDNRNNFFLIDEAKLPNNF